MSAKVTVREFSGKSFDELRKELAAEKKAKEQAEQKTFIENEKAKQAKELAAYMGFSDYTGDPEDVAKADWKAAGVDDAEGYRKVNDYYARNLVGGVVDTARNTVNSLSAQTQFGGKQLEAENAVAKLIAGDKQANEEATRLHNEYLNSLSDNDIMALEFSGQLLDKETYYRLYKEKEAQEKAKQFTPEKAVSWGEAYNQKTADLAEENGFSDKAKKEAQSYRAIGAMLPYVALSATGNIAGSVLNAAGATNAARMAVNIGNYLSSSVLYESAAGAAYEDAVAKGANANDALSYGSAVGAVELLTEKMFSGLGKIGKYATGGKAFADGIANSIAGKVASDEASRSLVLYAVNMLGEGAEEWMSELADRLANKIFVNTDTRTFWETFSDANESFLQGAMMSALFSATTLIGNGVAVNEAIEQATTEVAEAVEEAGGVEEAVKTYRNSTAEANAILRDDEKLSAYEAKYGKLKGKSNTEKVKEIARNLYDAKYKDSIWYDTSENSTVPFDYEDNSGDSWYDSPPVHPQTTSNVLSDRQKRFSEMIRAIKSGKKSAINEIFRDSTAREIFESETGIEIRGNTKSERAKFVEKTAKEFDIDSYEADIKEKYLFGNEEANRQNPAEEATEEATEESTEESTEEDYIDEPDDYLQEENDTPDAEEAEDTAETEEETADAQENKFTPHRKQQEIDGKRIRSYDVNTETDSAIDERLRKAVHDDPDLYDILSNKNTLDRVRSILANGEDYAVQQLLNYIQEAKNGKKLPVEAVPLTKLVANILTEKGETKLARQIVTDIAEELTYYGQVIQAASLLRGQSIYTVEDVARNAIDRLEADGKDVTEIRKKLDDISKNFKNVDIKSNQSLVDFINYVLKVRGKSPVFGRWFTKTMLKQDTKWLQNYASSEVMAFVADANGQGFWNAAESARKTAMLLSLPSVLSNIVGNSSFGAFEMLGENTVGSVFDATISLATGQRSTAVRKGVFGKAWRQNASSALTKAILEINGNINSEDAGTKYTRGRNEFSNRGFLGKVLYRASNLVSIGLDAPDQLFKGGQKADVTESLTRKNEDTEATNRQIDTAARDQASYNTFSNDTNITKASENAVKTLNLLGFGGEVRNGMREGGTGLGSALIAFSKVPTNIATKLGEYSPAAIAKGLYDTVRLCIDAKKGKGIDIAKQRKAVAEVTRGVSGIALVGLASALASAGIIIDSDDDDLDRQYTLNVGNRKGLQLNIDALGRVISGESGEIREGDTLIDLARFDPLNLFLEIGYVMSNEEFNEDATLIEKAGTYGLDWITGAFKTFMDMPMMQALNDFFGTFKNADEKKLVTAAKKTAINYATSFVPATVKNVAKAADPVTRDTSSDTFLGQLGNSFANATGIGRKNLPEKLDSLGNVVENKDKALNAINSLISPFPVSSYVGNKTVDLLEDVYAKTDRVDFYPKYKAPSAVNANNQRYDLTAEEKQRWKEISGSTYDRYAKQCANNKYFKGLTDEQKADVLNSIRLMSEANANRDALTRRGVAFTDSYADERGLSDPIAYYSVKAIYNSATDKVLGNDYKALDKIADIYDALKPDVQEKLGSSIEKLSAASGYGINAKAYYTLYDKLSDYKESVSPDANLSSWQKFDFINSNSDRNDKDGFLRLEMSDAQEKHYDAVLDAGYTISDYCDAYSIIQRSNSRKKDSISAMVSLGYSEDKATALYKLIHG